MSAVDVDSSACETASVASGDDVNGSISSSVLPPLGMINDQLGDSLLRDDSASSDVEDANKQIKEGTNDCIFYCLFLKVVFFVC